MKKLLIIALLLASLTLAVACSEGATTSASTQSSQAEVTSSATETTTVEDSSVTYKTVQNPVDSTGNDPWVVSHEGEYYYCWSGGQGGTGGVRVARIQSLDKIRTSNYSQVYVAPPNTMYSHEYWALELHYIQGE